jgi:hypothetical protein
MLPDNTLPPITRDNLNEYLKDLAKEFRKLNGNKTPAEIILIGGAAVLAKYGFRDLTYDVDAIIVASSAMKDAINLVGDKHGLPHGWLNADFKRTSSYSDKLFEVSVYYKTFSNIVTIRTVAAEYLLAMKLMSGRQYKNDLSDIVGILWEHQKSGNPIFRGLMHLPCADLHFKRYSVSSYDVGVQTLIHVWFWSAYIVFKSSGYWVKHIMYKPQNVVAIRNVVDHYAKCI